MPSVRLCSSRRRKSGSRAASAAPFFTPLYERTAIRSRLPELACPEEYERRMLGRNIRGKHAALFTARLEEIVCRTRGAVFTELELRYTLPGTVHCSVFLKLYEGAPRVDFRLELGKTLSSDIESVFLPLSLSLEDEQSLYLKKGGEAFRPGVDQIPGTCMEFYMSDDGLAFVGAAGSALIASRDAPLVYMGEMAHHPIRLCDNRPENNGRPVYSWVMNNLWETNFKMDLSGFCSFQYTLWLSDETDPEQAMAELHERLPADHRLSRHKIKRQRKAGPRPRLPLFLCGFPIPPSPTGGRQKARPRP